MSEPVRLSRERWEMLKAAKTAGPLTIDSLVSVTTANRLGVLTVTQPLEIAGIVFLPAEYVPPADPVRPQEWWQKAW